MTETRVVITGMGCVTPLGSQLEQFERNLFAGQIGVGRLSLFDASRFPVRIAAEVRDWDLSAVGEPPELWNRTPRQTQFAVGAGLMAAREAGLDDAHVDPLRFGVYLGCGEPFEDFDRFTQSICDAGDNTNAAEGRFADIALGVFDPDSEREFEPHLPAVHLAAKLNAQGHVSNCIAACVSSTQAIGESAAMIRRGEADVMLCGGAHSTIHPFGVTGFQRLSALSTRNDDPQGAARPFDVDRDGFVIGEGAACFLVERLDHALKRDAPILGELTGYGSAQDAFRVTDTHPQGRGTVAAIQRAVATAGLNPEQLDYINAHGTGTVLNDRVETLALKQALGAEAYRVPVSSTKSMLGHATTACGAIELAVCLLALRRNVVPPTMNLENADPDCDLDYVPLVARESSLQHVLTNNIGFGGQNAALIVSRFDSASGNRVSMSRAA